MLLPVQEEQRVLWSRFARDVLGCNCPPEVFGDIRLCDAPLRCYEIDGSQLVGIGGRLLLLLVEQQETPISSAQLAELAAGGTRLRDRLGYHRLRLVLVSKTAQAPRAALATSDDRVHLHAVHISLVPPAAGGN